MAELTIEQKALAYDEALERMKSWVRGEHPECFDNAKKAAEFIFPVLKNEDERIKKWLYNIIKHGSYLGEIPFEKNLVLAWIEKQGEVNTANKVEPTFKVGDWVVIEHEEGNLTKQIVEKNGAILYFSDGSKLDMGSENSYNVRFWSIDDAKEGDVLVASDGTLFILAKKLDDAVTDHASLSRATKGLIISAGNYRYEVANVCRPATKEELTIMLQRIDEAGYMWDGKAKELVLKEENKGLKEGDWLMPKSNYKPSGHLPFHISDKVNGIFNIEDCCGFLVDTASDAVINNYYRKWTIKDAKNGDILVGGGCMVIFKEIDGLNIRCHCTYHFMYNEAFYTNTLQGKDCFIPATPKQRVSMRKAITAEGYTFDFEKKELKKVDDEPIDKVKPKFEVGDTMRTLQEAADGVTEGLPVIVSIDKGYYRCNNECIAIKDQDNYEYPPMNRGQKPACNKEDNGSLAKLISIYRTFTSLIKNSKEDDTIKEGLVKSVEQLKELKESLQQTQEWGKNDDEHINSLLKRLKGLCRNEFVTTRFSIGEDKDWLKDLKDRCTWKPSDMPHWKKCTLPNSKNTGFNSDYFCHKGYCINYKELFEKLPKDD